MHASMTLVVQSCPFTHKHGAAYLRVITCHHTYLRLVCTLALLPERIPTLRLLPDLSVGVLSHVPVQRYELSVQRQGILQKERGAGFANDSTG